MKSSAIRNGVNKQGQTILSVWFSYKPAHLTNYWYSYKKGVRTIGNMLSRKIWNQYYSKAQ